MLHKIKYLTLIVGILLSFSGCNKYLDRVPLDGPSDISFFSNEKELVLGLNACYELLTFDPFQGVPLPSLLDNDADIGWFRGGGFQLIGNGGFDSKQPEILDIWKNLYQIIGRCNFLLDNVNKLEGKVNPALLARVTSEARFIRSYSYFYLSELYGGVPLITKEIGLNNASIPKTSKKDIAAFILKETEEAAENLPASYDAQNDGRATKGAALTLRARVALFNGHYDVAAASAKEVMDMNQYKLHSHFGELFTYKGQRSPEIIFALQYLKDIRDQRIPICYGSRQAKGFSNIVPAKTLVDSYECVDGLPIDVSPLYNPKNPFVNRDPRLGFTVALPGSEFFGYQFETNKDSLQIWNYNTTPATRVANTDATNPYATFTGFCWRKYTDIADKDDMGHSEINVIAMRYAEVLLIFAEAKIEAGQIDQSVYDAINSIRQRESVGMPAITPGKSQEEMRAIVRRERKYELANEGLRLFDIRRWKIAEKIMPGPFYGRIATGLLAEAPAIDQFATPDYSNISNRDKMRVIEVKSFDPARDYLWPIPYIELLTNPALEQNPNY